MATKLNFLIIEDEEDLREIYIDNINEWCMDQGYSSSIVEASDGIQASQKFANQRFNVLVVDINMPKRNGIEFLKSAREKILEEEIFVILVSGGLTKNHLVEAMDIGVKNVLVKPFVSEDFIAFLEKIPV